MYHSGNQMVDPYILFKKAHIQSGMHVADFGCGQTGHIVFPCAKQLGNKGIMYAVDIVKDALEQIEKRARSHSFLNIHTVWSDIERVGHTAIPPKSLDTAFLVNTLVQVSDRHAVLDEVNRTLKDKARLIVVDWAKKGLMFGPKDEKFVNFGDIEMWARQHNFVVQEIFDVGIFHQGMVLYKHE
jgi:ubiquinone/menaquinone biosynthesis C-methylase UbiE